MAITIGSARIDENGNINNGKPGDQTGREVALEGYYKHKYGWNVMRAKDPQMGHNMAYAMLCACNNNNYGYSQNDRESGIIQARKVNYAIDKVAVKCNVDCSSLVRLCILAAGTSIGDFYTGSELSVVMATGKFDNVTNTINQDTGEGLCTGDILVSKQKGHTVIVVDGKNPSDLKPTPAPTPAPKNYFKEYPVGANEQAVYRAYNPNSGEHIFVSSLKEGNALVDAGWNAEGLAWVGPKESDKPVYRLYNGSFHMYTADANEFHKLIEAKWKLEGIEFHSGGSVAVHRLINPNSGLHMFTADAKEKDFLAQNGWKLEGLGFNVIRAK